MALSYVNANLGRGATNADLVRRPVDGSHQNSTRHVQRGRRQSDWARALATGYALPLPGMT